MQRHQFLSSLNRQIKSKIEKFPLELQIIFYSDLYETIVNRIKCFEKIARRYSE